MKGSVLLMLTVLCAARPSLGQHFRVLDSMQSGSLTIYLIASDQPEITRHYLTLDEAIKSHKATLRETGTTNLQVENHSGLDIFVQSASIVKGGQQDRMLANDLIIADSSPPTPVPAYCVEHDRSFQRGREPLAEFSAANELAPLASLRVLAKKPLLDRVNSVQSVGDGLTAPKDSTQNAAAPDEQVLLNQLSRFENRSVFQESVPQKALQEAIWGNVGDIQERLSEVSGHSVKDARSPSSLQLSLEDSTVANKLAEYLAKCSSKFIKNLKSETGIAYSINGTLRGAEIYGSRELFAQELPSILKSLFVESRLSGSNRVSEQPTYESVTAFLEERPNDQFAQDISVREHLKSYSGGGHYRFETYDRAEPSSILHLSILDGDLR
jgi:hypothetical protein